MTNSEWTRTCQECGNEQQDTMPEGKVTAAYEARKCKKCKSTSLDYGRLKRESDPAWE